MADRPIIFALANPNPEIMPDEARAVAPDAIIATGRSDFPNQVNNVLCFPFIFRGALDVGATEINDEMKIGLHRGHRRAGPRHHQRRGRRRLSGRTADLRRRLPDPQTLRSAPDGRRRQRRGQGRDGNRRGHPPDRRSGGLQGEARRIGLQIRAAHAPGVRGRPHRQRAASSLPRARTSACCAPPRRCMEETTDTPDPDRPPRGDRARAANVRV